MSDQPNLAFLGLGAMGSRMAARLLDAGYAVTVYNRTPERAAPLAAGGATVAPTPREAVAGADIAFGMVRDDASSEALWLGDDGGLAALGEGAIVLESSTLTPAWARTLAGHVAARGGHFLGAPVVGTRPQAEQGILTFLVGGEAGPLAEVRAVLAHLGGAVHHIGPAGAGMAMKLAANGFFAAQTAATAELLGYLQRAGIAPEAAVETLSALPITSPVAASVAGLMLRDGFAPNFPIDLVVKDMQYALAAAGAVGADLPIVAAVGAAFAAAAEEGYGEHDVSGIIQRYR